MTQLDISTILYPNRTLNRDAVRQHAQLHIGSYLNIPPATSNNATADAAYFGFSALEWRELLSEVQNIFLNESRGHPILYGIDSVHGANYVRGSVIFGQQINAAASFNPDLVFDMGRITGRDTEAAGIPWVFGPILEISTNALWSRTYETFGEDPHLVSVMADAIVRGLQSNTAIAACMKHVIGYSKTPTGHDRDGVTLSDFDLLNYFAPPFLAAIKAGAMTAMANYISLNGVPMVANTKILDDLVRHDMQFDGMIVTDWEEINHLHNWHRVASTDERAVHMSLTKTSLDMSMVPYNLSFINSTLDLLEQSPEIFPRIQDSVRRILKLKQKLGLYDTPVPGFEQFAQIGQEEDRQTALNLARESITLLKNENGVLPLDKTARVFLTGHAADNVGFFCGGWSLEWQGVPGNSMYPNGVSFKSAMERIASSQGSSFTYFNGLSPNGSFSDLSAVLNMAKAATHTIVAIGEATYAEKPGDINDLALPIGQVEYVHSIAATGTKVILLLAEGRPRLLQGLADVVDAVIYVMLPGELGGQAAAEIVYGQVNPSGRLPITYPKDPANIAIPYNHRVTTQCADGPCSMEWEFGSGLSFTTFNYSNLSLSQSVFQGSCDEKLDVSVNVTNTGSVAGKETVMLFLIQPYRAISVPEVKQLKRFSKISLAPGEATTVTFQLTREDWSVFDPQIGQGFKRVAESGDFVIAIKPETDCDVYNEAPTEQNPLCATFTLENASAW